MTNKDNSSLILLATLLLATAVCLAEDSNIPLECRSSSNLKLAHKKVWVDQPKVHFLDKAQSCPSLGTCDWQRKAYVVEGDQLHEWGTDGEFSCVTFTNQKANRTSGWVNTADLYHDLGGTLVSPASEYSSGCDLSIPGIRDKDKFLLNFYALKRAVRANDQNAVASLVHFPVRVNGLSKTSGVMVRTRGEFIQKYTSIINRCVKENILKQKPSKIFCRDQGAMIAGDSVWAGDDGIIAFNIPACK